MRNGKKFWRISLAPLIISKTARFMGNVLSIKCFIFSAIYVGYKKLVGVRSKYFRNACRFLYYVYFIVVEM
jgi:hypothetical protein